MATSRLRWHDFISINLFWLGMNVRNTAIGSVFTPYLVAKFVPENVRNTALGAISTAGLVIAMLVQPAAGLLSDRSTSRFGRRRPFILVGTLFDLVFIAAIAASGSFAMLLIATLLVQFSANVSHGPLQALIPDLVPEEQRGRASAVKAVFELVPIILVGITVSQLVGKGMMGWAGIATGRRLAGHDDPDDGAGEGETAPGEAHDIVEGSDAPRAGDAGGDRGGCRGRRHRGWRAGRARRVDHLAARRRDDGPNNGCRYRRCRRHGDRRGGGSEGRGGEHPREGGPEPEADSPGGW